MSNHRDFAREVIKMSSKAAEKKNKVPVTLGYWKMRGLAQPIRLLLKYAGTEFENVTYENLETWKAAKFTLGLDFPNLPYLFEGDLKFTESKAIFHYIARKNNLCGSTEEERIAVEMVEGVIAGMESKFIDMCYSPKAEYEEMKPKVMEYEKGKLQFLSAYLGEKKWFVGDSITYVDMCAYEFLDVLRTFDAEIYREWPNIPAFLQRFEELPAIAEYMNSSDFIRRPINDVTAQWR